MKKKGLFKKLLSLSAIAAGTYYVFKKMKTKQTQNDSKTPTQPSKHILNTEDSFDQDDLNQEPDTNDAIHFEIQNHDTIVINQSGIYVITGSAEDVMIQIDTKQNGKVHLVFNNVNITNTDKPILFVQQAQAVCITIFAKNTLSVTEKIEESNAVICSNTDVILNGTGTLTINSMQQAIASHSSIKITGGTYHITSGEDALFAKDAIHIADGIFHITAGTNGMFVENDSQKGTIFIANGTFFLNTTAEALHGNLMIEIDDGKFEISGQSGIESTYIQINGGSFHLLTSHNGLHATQKSDVYTPTIEITDGHITIESSEPDANGLKTDGNLILRGGTIQIDTDCPLSYHKEGTFTGGNLTINQKEITSLNQL